MKNYLYLICALALTASGVGCASSKPNSNQQPPAADQPDTQQESQEIEEAPMTTTPVATAWTLSTESGNYEFENLGWKEVLNGDTTIFDYTRIQHEGVSTYRNRVFKIVDNRVLLSADTSETPQLWKVSKSTLKPSASWRTQLQLADTVREILISTRGRTSRCHSHPVSMKYQRAAEENLPGSVLIAAPSLFYADRALSSVTSAFRIETEIAASPSLHTFVGAGSASVTNGAEIDSGAISKFLVTANTSLFAPAAEHTLDNSDSYPFAAACEAAYRSATAELGKRSSKIDERASQLVDQYLTSFPNRDAFGNAELKTEKIY